MGGGFLVHDPLAGGVAGGLGVVPLIAVPAAGAGGQGEAHRRTGEGGHFRPVVVAQRLYNDGPAFTTRLGIGAGGHLAGDVAAGGIAIQTVSAAADAAVLGHVLAGAGAPRDGCALVPAMVQHIRVVGDEAGAAAVADMGRMAACLTGGRGGMGIKAVGQRRGDVLNVPIPAHLTLPDGIARMGAGGGYGIGGIDVLPLGVAVTSICPQRAQRFSSLPSASQVASRTTTPCQLWPNAAV